ncbi:hypothetical protein HPP92_008938 [Vanilla planifolia]|uniref:Pentatricopeptide repeat-containing protein n=1 Tax=Vanilla planifolia TaxID=51239 RepID=A0A835RIB0_VANPL|nr:hypothetical protein HPP92_008938 [Vanilla planifolia]
MAQNGRFASSMKLFSKMKDDGLSPDVVTYSALLSGCCKEEDGYSKAVHSLLNAYSANGDYRKLKNWSADMKSTGIEPNKVVLTTLLKVYARGGLFEKSHNLLTELQALGYAKDEMPYCLLMDNLAKAGKIEEAREVFEKLKENKVKSDGYAYSIMISAFCRASYAPGINAVCEIM